MEVTTSSTGDSAVEVAPEEIIRALREENDKLVGFVQNLPVAVLVTDGDGELILMNSWAARLLIPLIGGRPIGNVFEDFHPHLDPLLDAMRHQSDEPGRIGKELSISIPVGESRLFHFTCGAARIDAGRLLIWFVDQTMAREAEIRVREAIEHKAVQDGKLEMASGVIHDIGNAMSGMSTRVARQLREGDWSEVKDLERLVKLCEDRRDDLVAALWEKKGTAMVRFLKAVHESLKDRNADLRESFVFLADSLRHVEQIIALQRSYARHGMVRAERVSAMRDLIEDAVTIMRESLRKKSIDVRVVVPDDPLLVSCDPTRMVRVFTNLLKNAAESLDEKPVGEPRTLEVHASSTDWIHVQILDDGVGFEPERATELMRGGTTTKSTGSGRGMAICRSIVESHGGSFSIRSLGPGHGAIVEMMFPREATPPQKTN